LDELDNLEKLLSNIESQSFRNFTLYLCVNQPDSWWQNADKLEICKRNIQSIKYIKKYQKEPTDLSALGYDIGKLLLKIQPKCSISINISRCINSEIQKIKILGVTGNIIFEEDGSRHSSNYKIKKIGKCKI